MATITPVEAISGTVATAIWTGAATANTHSPIGPMNRGVGAARAAVTVTGTFGGATVVLQGSIDGTNYVTLTDRAGNAISFTAAGIKEFVSSCLYIRPSVSGGAGDSLVVAVAMRPS